MTNGDDGGRVRVEGVGNDGDDGDDGDSGDDGDGDGAGDEGEHKASTFHTVELQEKCSEKVPKCCRMGEATLLPQAQNSAKMWVYTHMPQITAV